MPSRSITLCLPYYGNATMLNEQFRRLRSLPAAVRDRLELIIVDDGTPGSEAQGQKLGLPARIFRIDVDIRWNQDAARNIAVKEATTPWVFLTDIDHLVPRGTWDLVLSRKLDRHRVFRFGRQTLEAIEPDKLTPYKPHPNTWLMTKALYESIGGYDERFAGHYGTDAEFRDRLVRASGTPITLDAVIIRVPRTTIPDASTTSYQRKGAPEDAGAIPRIKAERDLIPDWRPLNFANPYRQIWP